MLRHGCMVAALGIASLPGCIASSGTSSPLHAALTPAPISELPPTKVQYPRSNLSASHQTNPPESASRQVARRTPGSDPNVERNEQRPAPFKKTWHLDIGVRTSGLKLASTKQKLDRRLDIPLKLDVLGVYGNPTTPLDRKSELGLNTMSFGFGRSESERFGWNIYGGFGVGEDRNRRSFLLSTLDVNFKYAAYYAGFAAEYYPWTRPDGNPKMTWTERFQRAKPYFIGGFEVGFVSAEADGDFTVASVTIYKDGETIRDWIFSIPVGVGWAMPLSDRWSFQAVLDYRFHFYRPEEYNGWNLTTGLRWRL